MTPAPETIAAAIEIGGEEIVRRVLAELADAGAIADQYTDRDTFLRLVRAKAQAEQLRREAQL